MTSLMIEKGSSDNTNQLLQLWKHLINENMNKNDLKATDGISSAPVAKLGKCENIATDVLIKICKSLNVHLKDIMETIDD